MGELRQLGVVLLVLALAVPALAIPALAIPALAEPRPPELVIEAPESLAGQAEALGRFDRGSLVAILELVGLDDPGPPIRVVLAPEGTPAARRAPSWGAAYAIGAAGLVVLLPTRIPLYPDKSLDVVLRHEVAHVLIARAARRRPVPRWFNEGLAVYAARDWRIEDRARLAFAVWRREGVLADLDRRFQAGSHSASGAYALSAAFVRYLMERHGSRSAARILEHLAEDASFREAFRRATGATLAEEEERFWRHLTLWNQWVPVFTSSTTLWAGITGLALLAFKRRRKRDRELLEKWDSEDRQLVEGPVDYSVN